MTPGPLLLGVGAKQEERWFEAELSFYFRTETRRGAPGCFLSWRRGKRPGREVMLQAARALSQVLAWLRSTSPRARS